MYNVLERQGLDELKNKEPERFQYHAEGGLFLNLKDAGLAPMDGIDLPRIQNLARVVRGFAFAAINGVKSGHPGGSSSKVEQILALLLSGAFRFDPMDPKNPGRDRIVWSAGHVTPLFHAVNALIYESLNRTTDITKIKSIEAIARILPMCLARFRHCDGPTGHIESIYPLADMSTGASGHGLSAGLGFATLHKSCGLDTKVFVVMGDAESEEGMSYEARNLVNANGMDNVVVTMDWNGFGIDGPITDIISSPYMNHWFALGWNVIEVDGHNPLELAYAYKLAFQGFGNGKATVVICHTIKGKHYGKTENTADSHGMPASQADYVEIMKKLGFEVPGIETEPAKDVQAVMEQIKEEDVKYLLGRLNVGKEKMRPEAELVAQMEKILAGRPLADYRTIKRPAVLPPELVFKEGDKVPTRKATEAFFVWLMKQSAFFYVGSGDLAKSILTVAAENVYGVINKQNPAGRGIRFGIAEQNMAMMSTAMTQDILPGGHKAMTVFSTYGVFTSIMANPVRMALINNAVNPEFNGFFVMLAAHDGAETGEDGPTHHGLYWMSLFDAYPGIKVYKPMDANETIEMLFYAMEKGEPIALSVMRPPTPVLERQGRAPARDAVNGAYIYKNYSGNGGKKITVALCGGQILYNTMQAMPDIEKAGFDVKIIAVTSPELFNDLYCANSPVCDNVLTPEERKTVITIHNGWAGFMDRFVLPHDYPKRVIGVDKFLRAGPPAEVYADAGMDPAGMKERIIKAAS